MVKKNGRPIVTFDWAIKTILRDKANFDVLEGFLIALFGRPVVILDLLESEGNRTSEADKYNRVDLLAKTHDDERIIIEVQHLSELSYLRRLTYGTAKTIVENLNLGEPYTNLKKVYSISLLHFDVSEDGDDYIYHGKTAFTGFHTHKPVTLKKSLAGDRIRVGETNVFPEYYLIALKRFGDEVRDDLDEWVYSFKNNEVLDEFTAPGIGALKEKLDYLKLDEQERRRFDKHIDYARSERGMIEYFKRESEDAKQELEYVRQKLDDVKRRIEKARQEEELAKVHEEGLEKGREEERKKLIKSLHDNGIAIETIAASVGLAESAIRRLLNDKNGL